MSRRREMLFILISIAWILFILSPPNENTEFGLRVICLILPLLLAGRLGSACFEVIYQGVSELGVCKKITSRYLVKNAYLRVFIVEVIKIAFHLLYVFVMANNYWYECYFNRLTDEVINIPDLMRFYVAVGTIIYLIIITVRITCREAKPSFAD